NKLLCTWHVQKNWTLQGRKKIKDKTQEKEILRRLGLMLKATEEIDFTSIKDCLIRHLQELQEDNFLGYLTKYYLADQARGESWAHCYRKHAGINTNMHLAAIHRILKYSYLNGKSVQRLKSCLDALDKS
ncbi:hypothetical protein BDFB_014438, partial [Asbolus verrucosus]